MRGVTTELKVGIFALIAIAILSYITFKVSGGYELFRREGYAVHVEFKNIAGLDVKTKVKVAGVDAGVIEKIALRDGAARLTLKMSPAVKLYSDASAAIKATGLLGDKFLSVNIGSREPLLKDGDTIRTVREVVDIDDMARNLSEVSASINKLAISLNESLGSEEAKQSLRETIVNFREISENINTAVVANDRRLRDTLETVQELTASIRDLVRTNREPVSTAAANLREFSVVLKEQGPELIANLNRASKELKNLIEENRTVIQETTESFERTAESVENITAKIDRGEGTLGKLVKDERLYESLNKAAEGVNRTLTSVERFKTIVTFQGDYLTRPEEGKGYFNVTLQPRPDKYYIFGVVSDPLGRTKTTETSTSINGVTTTEVKEETEQKIEFTVQIAKRFTDSPVFKNTAVRAGITENTFGIGLDQFYRDDRLKISVDAWDFDSDETDAKKPHVRAGADYFVFKHLFVSAGIDNIFNRKNRGAYIGGGVRFEDEDIKYLLGTVPRVR